VKRLLVVGVLGALGLGATACDVSPPAATVNGVTISQSTLNAVLTSVATDADAQCATQVQSGLTASPLGVGTQSDGSTPNAVTPSFAASELQVLVLDQLEQQDLARRGVRVTAAEVTAATADYEAQLQTQLQQEQSASSAPSGCALSATTPLGRQLPRAFLDRQGTQLAHQELLEVVLGHLSLSDAALRAYYAAHLAEVTQECLNVIVADSLANAQALRALVAAGTSFATASTSSLADTQATPTGGALSCTYPGQLSSQLGTGLGNTIDSLSSGELAPPLEWQPTNSTTGQTSTFYLVVQMRQHVIVPFATLRSAIRQSILQEHAASVSTDLRRLAARSQISVDPRYGQWTAAGLTLPSSPPPAFVPNASANVATAPLSLGNLGISPSGTSGSGTGSG
jgi:hypothetical protein